MSAPKSDNSKVKKMTYPSGVATTTATTSATATTAATTTTRSSAAMALCTRTLSVGTLGLLASRLGLASKLNGDLALEDLLAGELGNGTLGLTGSRQVDEGVADGAVGTGILGDRD
jgi:hypothetical protein